MDTTAWLAAANAVVWIGLGAYLIFLALQQRAISARIAMLERLRNSNQD